jgi:hypothetical protein
MKLDSGVDVGLHERFSSLSLKDSDLNDLNLSSSKSHREGHSYTSNINILSASSRQPSEQHEQQSNDPVQPWELYFNQDEEGDT